MGLLKTRAAATGQLSHSEGYEVETQAGTIGIVEEVWLGPDSKPVAAALRTTDSRHALLLVEHVRSVERDHDHGKIVLTEPQPRLLELDAPRLALPAGEKETELVARWATTGKSLLASPPRTRAHHPSLRHNRKRRTPERPLWQSIALAYSLVAIVVVVVLSLTFLIPLAIEGSAY